MFDGRSLNTYAQVLFEEGGVDGSIWSLALIRTVVFAKGRESEILPCAV